MDISDQRRHRREAERFQRLFGLLQMGMTDACRAKMEPGATHPSWVQKMPSPLHDVGPGKRYPSSMDVAAEWFESQLYGDNHLLVEELARRYSASHPTAGEDEAAVDTTPGGGGAADATAGEGTTGPARLCNFVVTGLAVNDVHHWASNAGARLDHWIVICDPDDHERITREHLQKSLTYAFRHNYGTHFLNQPNTEEWEKQRGHFLEGVMPFSALLPEVDTMNKVARELVARIERGEETMFFYDSSRPRPASNCHELLAAAAFEMLCKVLFAEQDVDSDAFIRRHSQPVRWALQHPEYTSGPAKKILDQWFQDLQQRALARGLTGGDDNHAVSSSSSASAEARDGVCPIAKRGVEKLDVGGGGERKEGRKKKRRQPGALISRVLETATLEDGDSLGKGRMTRDNIMIMSLAGHDTTAATMTFLLFELSRKENRERLKRLQSEIDVIFDEKEEKNRRRQEANDISEDLLFSDFHRMPFLTACINETLRLYPAVPYGTMRQLGKDEIVRGRGGEKVLVPAGTHVMLPNFAPQRSQMMWGEDAGEWKPER